MKRRITFLSALSLMALAASAQSSIKPVTVDPTWGYQCGGGVELDMNNDGHLDILAGGLDRVGKHWIINHAKGPDAKEQTDYLINTKIYDPSTKTFKELLNFNDEANPYDGPIVLADRPSYIPVDMNMDGTVDFVGFCHNPWFLEGVFIGRGDGLFDYQKTKFVDDNGDEVEFPLSAVTTADVADFNNDGLPDIVTIGYDGDNNGCAILMNQGNYTFKVTGTDLFEGAKLALVQVEAADFNNDGYTDFIVSGNSDDPKTISNGKRIYCDIYQNLGAEEPGTFFATGIGTPNTGMIFPKANGLAGIADIDNDGKLDLFLIGESAIGDDGVPEGDYQYKGHIYKNTSTVDAISFKEIAQTLPSTDIRILNSVRNGGRMIDWDGDGDYDIVIGGWVPAYNTQTGFILLNDGKGNYSPANRINTGSETFMLCVDWDGNGVKDVIDLGQSWDGEFMTEEQKGRSAKVTLNPNKAAAAPAAPAIGKVEGKVEDGVTYTTLSWTHAAGAQKNFTYELYIKNAEGKIYNGCTSFIGGDKDGLRKTVTPGNMGTNTKVTLTLPKGKYSWGVQAVNASYDGSKFANGGSFEVTETGVVNAISDINAETGNVKVAAVYTANGTQIAAPVKGINIVKYTDGTTRKVVVK